MVFEPKTQDQMEVEHLRLLIEKFNIPQFPEGTNIRVGETEYLDQRDITETGFGYDKHGRLFMVIKGRNHKPNGCNFNSAIVVHQRYEDNERVIVPSRVPFNGILTDSALTTEDYYILRQILAGATVVELDMYDLSRNPDNVHKFHRED